MKPEIERKRREALSLLTTKRDHHLANGQTATANLYYGRIVRLNKGRYDNDLDDLIAGLKIGGENA